VAEGQASQDGEWSGGGGCHVQAASMSSCGHDGEYLCVSDLVSRAVRCDLTGVVASKRPPFPSSFHTTLISQILSRRTRLGLRILDSIVHRLRGRCIASELEIQPEPGSRHPCEPSELVMTPTSRLEVESISSEV